MDTFTKTQVDQQESSSIENVIDSNADFRMKEIKIDDLNSIKELWEKLNQIHLQDSRFFKEHFATNTFEKRCAKFISMNDKDIRIEVAENTNSKIIGYCISTINEEVGEIESLFIEEDCRKLGLGNLLVTSAIEWLKNNNCKKILVAVAGGHEAVFNFYMKNGFYPRMTYLELKE